MSEILTRAEIDALDPSKHMMPWVKRCAATLKAQAERLDAQAKAIEALVEFAQNEERKMCWCNAYQIINDVNRCWSCQAKAALALAAALEEGG